jgi:hypothetical protein
MPVVRSKSSNRVESRFFLPLTSALASIVRGSKEYTGLLITSGGGATIAKARTNWPDHGKVQTAVKRVTQLIVVEMCSWM